MAYSHRISDSRSCGAITVQQGQDFVTINGKLWAVEGDPNNHILGGLIHTQDYVTIGGILVILQGDSAYPDDSGHPNPQATGFDDLVDVT